MPRQERIIIPHEAHHITQRGNYRQEIFECDDDFKQYLTWLEEYSKKYKIDVVAYCLIKSGDTILIILTKLSKKLKFIHGKDIKSYNS